MRTSVRCALRGLAAVAVVAGAVGIAAPASAHVTVQAEDAEAGSTARVVFRMPNESDTDASNRLEVHLQPEGAPPVPAAQPVAVPGWSVQVEYEPLDEPLQGAHGEEITEAASVIIWTADDEDAAIQPGEVGEFPVQIGPLPEAEQLYFPVLQSYDGLDEPVRWIAPPEAGGEEPDNPAPVLQLAAPATTDEAAGSQSPAPEARAPESSDDSGSGSAGVWFGLAGLVAGLAGLALGGAAFARTRG